MSPTGAFRPSFATVTPTAQCVLRAPSVLNLCFQPPLHSCGAAPPQTRWLAGSWYRGPSGRPVVVTSRADDEENRLAVIRVTARRADKVGIGGPKVDQLVRQGAVASLQLIRHHVTRPSGLQIEPHRSASASTSTRPYPFSAPSAGTVETRGSDGPPPSLT
jgi:hypothetical protein